MVSWVIYLSKLIHNYRSSIYDRTDHLSLNFKYNKGISEINYGCTIVNQSLKAHQTAQPSANEYGR